MPEKPRDDVQAFQRAEREKGVPKEAEPDPDALEVIYSVSPMGTWESPVHYEKELVRLETGEMREVLRPHNEILYVQRHRFSLRASLLAEFKKKHHGHYGTGLLAKSELAVMLKDPRRRKAAQSFIEALARRSGKRESDPEIGPLELLAEIQGTKD